MCTKPYHVVRQQTPTNYLLYLVKAITSLGGVPVVEMSSTRIHIFAIRVATPVVSIHILVMIRHDQGKLRQPLRIRHFSVRSALAA